MVYPLTGNSILAIGAHPDDIEFGCGGTLLKYAEMGYDIFLLILTMGNVGGLPEIRKKEQEDSANLLGAKKIYWGNFEDTEVPNSKSVIAIIESVINETKPHAVLFNYYDDTHQDHRIAAEASISATRYIQEVLFFEVPSSRNFEPDVFVDVKDVLDKKLKLLEAHASQVDRTKVDDLSILESAKSCANFRGYQGRVKFAEGFKALRILKKI